MNTESEITTSALANREASRLINWLQLKMDYALTNEKSDVIFIDCNFVKRFISELRRLEKEMSELYNDNDLEALQLDKEAVECERDTSYERNAQLQAHIVELEEQLKNALNNN